MGRTRSMGNEITVHITLYICAKGMFASKCTGYVNIILKIQNGNVIFHNGRFAVIFMLFHVNERNIFSIVCWQKIMFTNSNKGSVYQGNLS